MVRRPRTPEDTMRFISWTTAHSRRGKDTTTLFAQTAKLYFKGDRPAGLRCPDCPDYRTCPESS